MTDIVWKGVEELQARIEKINAVIPAAVTAAALHVKAQIAKAPPVRRGTMPMTPKQHRWFMAALQEGLIDVPYRRAASPLSERLEQSWTVAETDGGYSAVVGNDTSYGMFVQDREKQHAYHKETGWVTVQDVRESQEPVIRDMVAALIRKAIG